MEISQTIKQLTAIPGVGKSIARDLFDIGIKYLDDLKDKDPQQLYDSSNQFTGCVQDR